MFLLAILGCNNGFINGFGGMTDGIFVPFVAADGSTGAYAQARAVDPGCPGAIEPDDGVEETPVGQLCAILAEVLTESRGSEISASTSVFRVWSAWYDPAAGELVGRAASSVNKSACTGDELAPDDFVAIDTVATVDTLEAASATITFTGDFSGTTVLHLCDEVALE